MFYDTGVPRGFYVTAKTNIHVTQEWQTGGTCSTDILVFIYRKNCLV